MIRTKKWTITLVLTIMLALTISDVNAKEYVADDNYSITSQYHDIFNNYFGEDKEYLYFPYSCLNNYSRECYFGIDKDGNYLDISYIQSGTSYVVNYSTGIDENFSVIGNNVFRKKISPITTLLYGFSFFSIIIIVLLLLF